MIAIYELRGVYVGSDHIEVEKYCGFVEERLRGSCER